VTNNGCEWESAVVAATHSGESTAELNNHWATCAACAETRHVTRSLLQHAAMTLARSQPPAQRRIWRKMQERRQRFARKRATRGLAVMWVLALAYFVALLARYLPALWYTQSANLGVTLRILQNGVPLAGLAISVIPVALGSCYLLVSGRRIDSRLALN
jgi:hypothetical protein